MACNLTGSLPTFHMTFAITKADKRSRKIRNILRAIESKSNK